jgi:DNA-binding winged helix-turn-helix (wHTH) protein
VKPIARVVLESTARRMSIDGTDLPLTTVEYEILSRLTVAAGSVIERQQLMREVFERQFDPEDRSLDVHISRLRKKLGPHGWLLVTVRGSGHMLRAVALAFALTALASPSLAAQEATTVQGDWLLNRELSPPPQRVDDEDVRRPEGRRPQGGGGVTGGGRPVGGLGGGRQEGWPKPSDKERRRTEAVRSRMQEAPERLVISIDGTRVQIIDALGRATNLVADGKKQERVTGDGEFKSITKLDRGKLVVEEDFGGPKVTTTYERLQPDGTTRLQVTLQVDGRAAITRIYDSKLQP